MRAEKYQLLIFAVLMGLVLVACKEEADFALLSDTGGSSGSESAEGDPMIDPDEGENGNISGPGEGEGEDGGEIGGTVTDVFTQDQFTERYDFLWVVDNSGSMSNIHDFMSQQLSSFASVLESRRSLDWQMAVTITDHAAVAGDLVSGTGGVRVVTHDSTDPSTEWASIINNISGTTYAGWEQGLESGRSAIESYGNEFNRSGVPLIVAYISDEEDYSCQSNCNGFSGLPENQSGWVAYPTSRYVDHFNDLKSNMDVDVIVYPIVHMQPIGGPNGCEDNYGFVGTRYMEVQQLFGSGQSLSICEDDLANSFNQVAQLTANLGVCFTLTKTVATTEGMEVTVDGNAVQPDPQNGYVFESPNNAVCFTGSYIPDNGAIVQVTYQSSEN